MNAILLEGIHEKWLPPGGAGSPPRAWTALAGGLGTRAAQREAGPGQASGASPASAAAPSAGVRASAPPPTVRHPVPTGARSLGPQSWGPLGQGTAVGV